MKELIILISGKMGSGKTTLMKELTYQFEDKGYFVYPVIFADTIYKIHDFAINLLKERGIERDLVKDGKLLQLLGTEWGRQSVSENIWVQCLEGEIESIRKRHPSEDKLVFLVSDCRFKNEFDGLPTAFKVRLEASKEARKERCSQWRENDTHQSEIDLDGYAANGAFDCYLDTEETKFDVIQNLKKGLAEWLDATVRDVSFGYQEVCQKYYV
jgi:dephospho-CoA kinase